MLPREKGHKYEVEHRDGVLYIRTDKDAKNFRLVTAPLSDPLPAGWRPLLDHRPDVLLEEVELFRDFLAVQEKEAGLNRCRARSFADGQWREVAFPEPVYSASAVGTPEFDSRQLRYSYRESPSSRPRASTTSTWQPRGSTLRKREEVAGRLRPRPRYVSERLWATARDGAKVPISIVYPKGFVRDGRDRSGSMATAPTASACRRASTAGG